MSKSYTWFGTRADARQVLDWLQAAGARQLDGRLLDHACAVDGGEQVLHFPGIGPVELWAEVIDSPAVGDRRPRASRQRLAAISQQRDPQRRQIDVDQSAVAGLRLPEFRDERFWVAGQVSFPTTNLKTVFPELHRVCKRFGRFLMEHHVVYDNRKGSNQTPFGDQICPSGVLQLIVALPEAYSLLTQGHGMVDHLASPATYQAFCAHWHASDGH